MSPNQFTASIHTSSSETLQISYLDHHPPPDTEPRGTILLIHGFPQTSYQFRRVLPLLANKGYRCITPDYRGAGGSSKTANLQDYRKSSMAADTIALLDFLNIREKVHIVGHDIGGMIAFALASRWPERVKSACWGECPLPGTKSYERDRTVPERTVQQFHFAFHCVPELPEKLVEGKERVYIEHFFDKIAYNRSAIGENDMDVYASAFEQPGAMSCGFNLYRTFEDDARENVECIKEHGKCDVPTLALSGEFSKHKDEAEEMALEVTEKEMVEVGVVEGAGHYLAEENPEGFVDVVASFFETIK